MSLVPPYFCFFFNDTATTEIYTLSLHDALPISARDWAMLRGMRSKTIAGLGIFERMRSEEHTSELQSRRDLVCRLLLEKKKLASKRLLLAVNTGGSFWSSKPPVWPAKLVMVLPW